MPVTDVSLDGGIGSLSPFVELLVYSIPLLIIVPLIIWAIRRTRSCQREGAELVRESIEVTRENNRLLTELIGILRDRRSI
jgi:hypothetical protein